MPGFSRRPCAMLPTSTPLTTWRPRRQTRSPSTTVAQTNSRALTYQHLDFIHRTRSTFDSGGVKDGSRVNPFGDGPPFYEDLMKKTDCGADAPRPRRRESILGPPRESRVSISKGKRDGYDGHDGPGARRAAPADGVVSPDEWNADDGHDGHGDVEHYFRGVTRWRGRAIRAAE